MQEIQQSISDDFAKQANAFFEGCGGDIPSFSDLPMIEDSPPTKRGANSMNNQAQTPGEWMVQATVKIEQIGKHIDEHRQDFKEHQRKQDEIEEKRKEELEEFKKDFYTHKGRVNASLAILGAFMIIVGTAFFGYVATQSTKAPTTVIQKK